MSRTISYIVMATDHPRMLAIVFGDQVECIVKFQKAPDGSFVPEGDLPDDMLLNDIMKIDGVEKCDTSRYSIVVTRGLLFDWTNILQKILRVVQKRATLTEGHPEDRVPRLVFIPKDVIDKWNEDVEEQWSTWLMLGHGQEAPPEPEPVDAPLVKPKKERLM